MPTPFDRFGFTEAQQTVRRADQIASLSGLILSPILGQGVADSTPRPIALGNITHLVRQMLDGDMWLGGFGWIGPRPQSTADGYSETISLLQQGFISQNVLAEVIERHVSGVLGREPQWAFTPRRNIKKNEKPTTDEETLIGEAAALVTEWWDARKVHKFMEQAVRTLLYARRSVVRLYVPRGKLASENITDPDNARSVKTVKVIRAINVPAGLSFVWPDAPLPESSTVAEDADSKESIGVVLYRAGQNVTGTSGDQEIAEFTYLSEANAGGASPMTVIRQTSTSASDRGSAVRLDFGGRLSMYEMNRAPFITVQMIQLQRALNLALTALPKNVIQAGWLERVIANAQMPGRWIPDANASSGRKWVPDVHMTGGATTTYLRGLKQENPDTGAVQYSTPSVSWREPSPVAPTVEAQEALYRSILREARQEHILVAQATAASEKSREQARADFEMTLRPTASEVNALGRWLIETALAMAEAFSGAPGKYTKELRANFECQIDTGPVSSNERTAIDASVAAGTLSRETAMSLEGIGDPAAEIALIMSQPGANLDVVIKQVTAFSQLVAAGSDIEGAALAVGIDPKIARGLVPTFTDVNPDGGGDPNADPANPGLNGRRPKPASSREPAVA